MHRLKILLTATLTAFIGTLVYYSVIECFKSAEATDYGKVVAAAKGPGTAEKSPKSEGVTKKETSVLTEGDTFASSVKHSRPTILIESSIDGGRWVKNTAIYPLKGQKIVLKAD